MSEREQFLWTEKYRPKKIDDVILPESIKKTFRELVAKGELPNMILTGTAGVGKTTIARALCNEMDIDHIVINGSDERNIDTLRGKIRKFASTVSLEGKRKAVILDEADYLNPQSTQPALRGFIEEFSGNCAFIFTCNYKNRLIEPLHSRASVYEFNTSRRDLKPLAGQFFKRLTYILDQEGIKYDQKAVADLILKHAPDWRRIVNETQRYSASGVIDAGILKVMGDDSYNALFEALKKKDFNTMRKFVATNPDLDTTSIFRGIYDRMNDKVKASSRPALVILLGEYQYKAAFVADHELNIVACLTEIMSQVEFE
jgi:DNA polymerase III delta prime subunit